MKKIFLKKLLVGVMALSLLLTPMGLAHAETKTGDLGNETVYCSSGMSNTGATAYTRISSGTATLKVQSRFCYQKTSTGITYYTNKSANSVRMAQVSYSCSSGYKMVNIHSNHEAYVGIEKYITTTSDY